MSKPMHHLNIGNESYEVVDSTARNAADVLTGQVDQLVVENTTNASGWKVVTTQQTVEKDTDNTACTFSDLPEDFVLLEASYSDTTIAGFRETDGLRTNVWHTTAGDGVTFTVPSANVATTNVIFYLTYAYPDSVDLSELTDIRVGADGTVYQTAGEAVRSQIQAAKSSGINAEVKQALMDIANYVAWKNNDPLANTYINALQAALYPPANLVSISAVYTQSGTVYDTGSLDDLKNDLVVTANYDDSTSEAITTYTLTGTLTVGTSTITVSYGGKTTTFDVTVSKAPMELTVPWQNTTNNYAFGAYTNDKSCGFYPTSSTGTNSRCTLTCPTGDYKYRAKTSNTNATFTTANEVDHYAIPIPSGATSVTLTLPSAYEVIPNYIHYDTDAACYKRDKEDGTWRTASTTHTFDCSDYNDGAHYIAFNIKARLSNANGCDVVFA